MLVTLWHLTMVSILLKKTIWLINIVLSGVLALAMRANGKNMLQLYDVSRMQTKAVQGIVQEPFAQRVPIRRDLEGKPTPSEQLEVTSMSFSPDGMYLAMARTDNTVHMYDSRMLSKGALSMYSHEFLPYSGSSNTFGVTGIEWITTRTGQFRLLSGGEDGE